jgi:MAF protein
MKTPYILASSSPYRKQLLAKFFSEFETFSPNIDESPKSAEQPHDLVMRLAVEKAYCANNFFEHGIVIASDQIALFNNSILGKPHTVENAISQLELFSGNKVTFLTSLCVYDIQKQIHQVTTDFVDVHFKPLSHSQIAYYVAKEQPLNCAGSFKSEGLGIALFEKLVGKDPNTLVGLPLIELANLLANWDIEILSE